MAAATTTTISSTLAVVLLCAVSLVAARGNNERSPGTPVAAHGRRPSPSPAPDFDIETDSAPPGLACNRMRECWRYIKRNNAMDNVETSLWFSVVVQTRCGTIDILIDDARVAIAVAA
jgi:hypothetical protein